MIDFKHVKISIIVPVYKVENLIERCINSILNQTIENFELILIDDGSPDKSGEICDQYARQDNRIRVIHKKNEGAMAAWIDGVKIAKGRYIGFVDSDDYIESTMYELLHYNIEIYHADIIACGAKRKSQNETIFYQIEKKSIFKSAEIIKNVIPDLFNNERYGQARWNKLIKSEIVRKNLLYCTNGIVLGEDLNLVLACTLDARKIVYIPDILYYYCENKNSVTASIKINSLENGIHLYKNLTLIAQKKNSDIYLEINKFYNNLLTDTLLNFSNIKTSFSIKYKMIKKYIEYNPAKGSYYDDCKKNKYKIKRLLAVFLIRTKQYKLLLLYITFRRLKRT
ncbi:glycosyltransferase family 2 protein [Anaerosinus massiliensis]|uniref:glycosyltransferase family 2 protein n=1 Tax=Massilibacillus massiliensis TaxID=1806837 RepID=UPI000AD1BE65|nr:glycosyltransferase [Massilibacillus massiliensis]